MKKFTLISVMLFIAASLIAQTPQAFKYQAVARNSTGNLIQNQLVAFRINILQGYPSGTLVYQERHTLTTNNYGLANLNIGTGTVLFGTFSTINWAAGQMYIKVELDPAGGTAYLNMGTSELLSVPYALYSGSATGWGLTGNSGTNPAVNFVGTTDNVPLTFRVNNLTAGKIDHLLYNTSLGYSSLNINSTGNSNSAVGYAALLINTTGSFNTAIGRYALSNNSTAGMNTATGYGSLYSNTTGESNTANGLNTLYSNTTGYNNAAIGASALYFNTTGFRNTALGAYSLYANKANSRSTAVGYNAMYFADDRTVSRATYNTAVGYEALKGSTTSSLFGLTSST